ncbi:MAG TPA: carbohydrate kinase family protein [Dongiaceae bacterium]|nr:carbohydrate kinase family protein [Dongiaceae bacterium]
MTSETLFSTTSLCVAGNLNRDVQVRQVPGSAGLLSDGETGVSAIVETVGGGGANSACAAAALGARVRFVGKTGADALGERLRQALEQHGVRTHLARDPRCATGTTVALGYASGQRHFLSCLPNNQTLTFEDLDLSALEGCRHLLRADVWFSQAMLEGGNRRLLAAARQAGLATSLDINFDPQWSTGSKEAIARRKQQVRGVLDLVDLAHGNRRELCEFTDSPGLDTALRRLTDWGVKAVVVHLGSQGAGYWKNGQLLVEPPEVALHPINSTGTGDVLSICMILLEAAPELSTRQKLRLANGVVRDFMEGRRKLIPSLG